MKKNKFRIYRILRTLFKWPFMFYYNPKIINKEYIPKDGTILIVGNHKHLMDQFPVIFSTKRVVRYMAKKEYFEGRNAWFFRLVGCIRVDRTIKDETAKSEAMDVLKGGGALGLFPEGTRNKTNEFLLPFKFGAVSMAKKNDAYLVPFGITGDYKFRSKNLVITFGKPFKVTDLKLEEANELLRETIGNLMKESKNRKL